MSIISLTEHESLTELVNKRDSINSNNLKANKARQGHTRVRLRAKKQKSLQQSMRAKMQKRLEVNPRTYKQSHTPTVVEWGGVMEPLPWVFAVFQYFGEILPVVESL